MIFYGAFGRVWLGGDEENIAQAAKAIETALATISGRENKPDKAH